LLKGREKASREGNRLNSALDAPLRVQRSCSIRKSSLKYRDLPQRYCVNGKPIDGLETDLKVCRGRNRDAEME
jgi:hypothetical protein